ncbi:hypothetical protein V3C99_003672 [Haemonchus contortus]
MKNVVLAQASCSVASTAECLKGCGLFVEDNVSNVVYFVNQDNVVILDSELMLKDVVQWNDQFDSSPVKADLLQDSNELCIILRNGQVITMDIESHAICSACFLGEECSAASWSPDQVILTVVEGDRVVFYDRCFEISGEWNTASCEAGKDSLISVGWGAAETQFQGSAGKAAREKVVEVVRTALPNDTHKPYLRWRADGQYVVVSFYEEQTGERRVAVFNRDGELMARLKNVEPLEEVIAVRPSGNYIATTKQTEDGNRAMVFYERNGEKRHEAVMPCKVDKSQMIDLQWDIDSSCLCVHLRTEHADELEIWTVSNYDWKRQWTAVFPQRVISWQWHAEKGRHMCVLFDDGYFAQMVFALMPTVAGTESMVIATDELRFTNFNKFPIPPPLCEFSLPHNGGVHAVSYDGSRLAVLDADCTVRTYFKNAGSDGFTLKATIEVKDLKSRRFIHHLVWKGEHLLAIAHIEGDEVLQIDMEKQSTEIVYKSPVRLTWIGVRPSSNAVVLANVEGLFGELVERDEIRTLFRVPSSELYDVKFNREQILVLTSEHELFVDGHGLANSVTSYLISDDVCIYITLHHKLHLISLATRQQLGKERAVELGSQLIACAMDTGVIMQMPRGNLETIHPRPFVIRVIKQLLDDGKFVEALKQMKKHRIDMNFIVDYKPEMFIANISKLVTLAKDVELVCILVAALSNERSMWCDGEVLSNKVNRVTELLAEEVLNLPDDRRLDMFVVLLSALLKSSPQQVERALRCIKKETDKMSIEKRDLYTRKWIHHVRFFVDEARLFNAALATYDLNLTLQVAEVSNRDPKEYVPILNEFRKMEPEDYRKYRIDLYRSDWESALKHLSYLDDKWDEVVKLIREKNLYSTALILFRESPKYKDSCSLYAAVLETKAQWDEATLLYEKAGEHEKELRCLEMMGNIDRFVSRAHRLGISEELIEKSLNKIALKLKAAGRWTEAAKALRMMKSSPEQLIEAYLKAGEWMNTVEAAESSGDMSSVKSLLVDRAHTILKETATRSEQFQNYAKRLEVVRGIKKDRIANLKDGIETGADLEASDLFSETGSTYSMASRRTGKTGVSRASTTASVRKRKQIDRKKQSLKEGGEYEDAALLIALASHYKWLDEITAELMQLLPALVHIDEIALASSTQHAIDQFFNDLAASRFRIWPNKLHPWDLPGPIYALYNINDIFTFPADGGMPEAIAIEPEMVAPTLDTNRKWKMQILS